MPPTGFGTRHMVKRGATGAKKHHLFRPSSQARDANNTPHIVIDHSAGSKDLINYPPLDVCGELSSLKSGDVLISGTTSDGKPLIVGVEVKSIDDLLGSIETGRLIAVPNKSGSKGGQLHKLLASYDECWLLHYGRFRPGYGGELEIYDNKLGAWRTHDMAGRAVPYGYLSSPLILASHLGVNVVRVGSIEEAAEWLGVLARWHAKPAKEKGERFHVFDRSRVIPRSPGMSDEVHRLANMLNAAFDGLGYKRAVAAAVYFKGSVTRAVMADAKDWEQVPGIGRTIAKSLVEWCG